MSHSASRKARFQLLPANANRLALVRHSLGEASRETRFSSDDSLESRRHEGRLDPRARFMPLLEAATYLLPTFPTSRLS